ncbi:MAG: formylglycine-generating enzyme family protein [Candidatus Aminicenantes bacterium]|nr:formylglycine-generating enzyme family protein [Candidatus Aminicenantes bacterium]
MEFMLIPAGSFLMGSNTGEEDEKPVHRVTITKPFYMGKYEVTQEQWQALMGSNPSRFKGPKNPVEQVSWFDCRAFLAKLKSKASGKNPRLPTEAEWEYACRAGSRSEYSFGDRDADLRRYAWYGQGLSGSTHPVGEKEPNAWGLHDMHGNVWEWCSDVYGGFYYKVSPEIDPQGADFGGERLLRGGSWLDDAVFCHSAARGWIMPAHRDDCGGFRAVLPLPRSMQP